LRRLRPPISRRSTTRGGINGRKIVFLSYDDGYSPPKTVEQTRRLVESDEVLLVFNAMGTATNSAVQKYLNGKRVPQLFVSSGAAKWNDPKGFPWTIGFTPSYETEAEFYTSYLLENRPNAKIAVLFQNDDLGKDYVRGLKRKLGPNAQPMVVAEEAFDISEPSIDSHLVKLKASGADVLLDIATPKFAAQAIKRNSGDWLATAPSLELCVSVDRQCDQASGPRECPGYHFCSLL
jgi:branched-chain amino acid transport system substrate-binding protein